MKKFVVVHSPKVAIKPEPTYEYRTVAKEVDGRVLNVIDRVEIDPCKVLDGLKASDFSLDVIIRQGATDLLRESSPIAQSPTQVLNTFNEI